MKIIKWSLVIAVTAALTCILLFTFIQEPFRATAPVKVFWYEPGEFPIYMYVAATFGMGLLIGFFAAAYYYIAGQAGIHSKKRQIKRLEETIRERDGELEKLLGQARDRITKTQRALGDTEKDGELEKLLGQAQDKITRTQKALGDKDLTA
ncbi:MAG: lipopolysaccharide assembly protein LapA domain-containing protein [Chitinispirillales bacterium]|jgi:uncharacterized integral membrane protein|nr:lipopolysaccharide assembly protein LapA domain-containing protein [Chitinispirillales bacterium]